jgi:NAD(P)-dependent dehydrogenase (short-subunit alcohol dehydrogenase family)
MTLEGRGVLVTGAKRIGAAIALGLARQGADVAIAFNRSRDEAERCAEQVRQLGRRAFVMQADVAEAEACEAIVAGAVRDLGRLDVLIHLASIYDEVPFEELDAAGWDRQLNVDLRAAFLCARAAAPAMRAQGGGRIILFSDWVAASGRPRYRDYVAYYVAKAGVIALAQALALELAGDRILVNAIAPGPILAPPGTPEAEMQAVERATPLGRWGGPHEVVKAVLALVDSDFITGETIRVDGGRHLH